MLTTGVETARVWDLRSFKPITPPLIHGCAITAAAWTADETRVATIGGKQIRVWDAKTGELLRLISQDSDVGPAAISRDGKWALTANGQHGATLWDVSTATRVKTMDEPERLWWATFSNDGKYMLTLFAPEEWAFFCGEVRVREVKSLRDAMPPTKNVLFIDNLYTEAGSFSPDSKRVVINAGKGFLVYQIKNAKLIVRDDPTALDDILSAAFFTPDAREVVCVVSSGVITVCSSRTGNSAGWTAFECVGSPASIGVGAGTLLALKDHEADVFSIATGAVLGSIKGEFGCCGLSPHGDLAACGCPDSIPKEHTEIWRLGIPHTPADRDHN